MPDPVLTSPSRKARRSRPATEPAAEPRTPTALERWRRQMAVERRRLREMLTVDRLVSFLKTLAWVVPLTVLIWIYAEREQAVIEDLRVPVTVAINDINRVVELREPAPGRALRIEVYGPRSSLANLRRDIGDAMLIEVNPTIYSPGREHDLGAAALLNDHPLLMRHGVSVRTADPPTLRVFVDSVETREVTIQAPPDLNNLDGMPAFDPPQATVRGPRSVLERAEQTGDLVLYANLARLAVLNEPGDHELSDVSLYPLGELSHPHISISPSRVRANIRVRQPHVETPPRSMPVWVQGSSSVLNNHQVIHDQVLHNVVLIGPPEEIERLDDPRFPRPVAVLEITGDDRAQLDQERTRTVRFSGLPEGVRVKDDGDGHTVRFTVTRVRTE